MENNDEAMVLETTKEFDVPVEKLYKAWNSTEQLKEWWHPFNKNLTNVTNDLRPGGAVQYDFDGEQKCHVTGEYQEVIENKKLVYSWNWDLEHDDMKNGDYTLTVDFVPAEGGSSLKIRQEGFTDANATEPHKQGWDRGLAALKTFLETAKGGSAEADISADENPGEKIVAGKDNQEDQHIDRPKDQKNMADDKKIDSKTSGQVENTSQNEGANDSTGITKPKTDQPAAKAEGQPELTPGKSDDKAKEQQGEQPLTGKGPKPVGPSQESWDNPEASEEVKKKIEEQKARQNKLQENPNAQDPGLEELNKKQDIESRNEEPDQDKKSEKNTQEDFDPKKNDTEPPAH